MRPVLFVLGCCPDAGLHIQQAPPPEPAINSGEEEPRGDEETVDDEGSDDSFG